ncbi:non-ribosomal peptide synthetase [Paenibacillus elgii]|uniref:PlpD n=1 Tax=Paenibacillus elgii TaxID=189691 RepID=I1Z6A2_9BACL|nr:non-ribosomal peptide synthetase [Paenibacillus elgii]AFJ14793.1 PlpD [Paenibacillus elgii]
MSENTKQRFPLTQAQLRIWYTEMMNPDTTLSMLSESLKIQGGPLDVDVLKQAIYHIIRQNDAFRIRIAFENNEPMQWFEQPENIVPECDYAEVDGYAEAETWLDRFNRIPIGMFESRLYHIVILKVNENEHWVVCKFNHITLDGLSSDTMLHLIMEYYIEIAKGNVPAHHAQSTYLDYIYADQEYGKSDRYQKDKEYWLDKFRTLPEVMGVKSYSAHAVSTEAKRKSVVISGDFYEKLRAFSERNNVSLFTLFLSVLYVYLYKATGNEDISVGTILANRTSKKEKATLGMFASTIAGRISVDPDQSLLSLLHHVSKEQKSDLRHQKYPYNQLIQDLREVYPNKQEVQDLFRVSMEYLPLRHEHYDNLSVRHFPNFGGYEAGDFLVDVYDSIDDRMIDLHVSYRAQLYDDGEASRLVDQLLAIVNHMLDCPDQTLRELSLLSDEERENILTRFNPSAVDDSQEQMLHVRFEEQAAKTPEHIAVVDKDKQLTYGELNERANRLAGVLRDRGIGRESIVGILADRSAETLVGVLAVWKAGGAYVPLDPDYPQERIEFMLEDSASTVLLTQTGLKERVQAWLGQGAALQTVLCLDDEALYAGDPANLPNANEPHDLAYVIYTSGTTGRPKGVMIEHRSLTNTAAAYRREYRLDESPVRLLQLASFSFDVFVGDVARTLYNGGTMVICPKEDRIDPSRMYGWIREYGITVFESTPALIVPFMDYVAENGLDMSSMKLLITSSDSCSVSDYRVLQERYGSQFRIINAYGVTEAAIDSSFYDEPLVKLPDTGSVPIGKAWLNAKFYIVDPQMNPVPVGFLGELCIGGIGVARGYLNRPELTAEKFVDSPFVPGERLYRTGDLARWMEDGNVDFIGRIDYQVKIRGFRIELGEIESAMLRFDGVKQAIVVDRTDERGQKYLVGYTAAEETLKLEELQAYLKQTLPAHMVPSRLMRLERLPLTPNGKIDRKALPVPEGTVQTGAEYEAPGTPQEIKLAGIWQDVLGLEKIGLNDNFFDLGGHSLRATILASKIQKEMNVEFPMRDVFRFSTMGEMAQAIARMEESLYESIPAVEERDYYPVSSAQKRLYILRQLDGAEHIYNMPVALIIEGELDRGRMEQAFRGLIARHEALRTSFELVNGDPMQRVYREVEFALESGYASEEEAGEFIQQYVRPFDLERPPLLRAGLISLGRERQILLFDVHHIVSDGISMNILLDELVRLYRGEELPPLRVQYKDYAVWQQSAAQRERMQRQEAYWTSVLDGELPVLELPTDYARPSERSYEGDELRFVIDKAKAERLLQIAEDTGATLYMLLLAAYTILLHKYSGQEDVIVGTPVAGRTHADVEPIVGMFVNSLAIRSYPAGDKPFLSYIEEIKETTLQAFDNQDYPLEGLLEKVQVAWDQGRNPLFDTMFVLQNADDPITHFDELPAEAYAFKHTIAKFDLTLEIALENDTLNGLFEYCTKLFTQNMIDNFAQDFVEIVSQICERPYTLIKDIALSGNTEQEEISADAIDFVF